MEVVKIGTQQMIASSLTINNTEVDAGMSLSPFLEQPTPAEMLNLPIDIFE